MGFWSKLVILALAALAFFYVKVNFFDTPHAKVEKKLVVEEQVAEPVQKTTAAQDKPKSTEPQKPKTYVTVYFLGMDKNEAGIFKKVKRELPQGQTKLSYALNQLVAGPTPYEKKLGVYSEIPSGTEVLSIKEYPDKVVINLSAAFETGGGTDSLYKRLYQLIKTAKRNTTLPVYLYIEGQKADVIGGEGIMLNQPLNDSSLDG